MKYLLILCILSFNILKSQSKNYRFIYEYKYAQDSTKIDSTQSELMYLDIVNEGSRFYSRDVFVGDSLMNEAIRKQNSNGFVKLDYNKGKQRDVIKKFYPDFNVITITNVGLDSYTYEDDRKYKWSIYPTIETINGFKVQKATTKIFGRMWTAWFTSEFPFQDGPYKFHGLPGIIVKIEDTNKGHIFSLIGIKILKKEEVWPLVSSKNKTNKFINTTRNKYIQVFQNYRKDPMKDWRARMGGAIQLQATYNGKNMDSKDIEKFTLQRLKKDNNILEKDLLDF